MTITCARFQNFERFLRAVTDAATSDVIRTLIAARITHNDTYAKPIDFLLADNESIDLDAFAASTKIGRGDAYRRMCNAHRQASVDLGFGLFDLTRSPDAALPRGMAIDLSKSFLEFLRMPLVDRVEIESEAAVEADAPTEHGLKVIALTARAAAAGTFLYRVSPAMADLQIRRLVSGLKALQVDAPVLIGGLDQKATNRSLIKLTLSTLLHADANGILVLPHVEDLAPASASPEADEWDEPVKKTAPQKLGSEMQRFLSLTASVGMTTVLAVPAGTILDTASAANLSGAFGPFRVDQTKARAAIIAKSPLGVLDDRQAGQLLDAVGDPSYADEVLRIAGIVTRASSGGVGKTTRTGSKASQPASIRPEARGTQAYEDFGVRYNRTVEDLAGSLVQHAARPTSLRESRSGPFDPELFVSDPDPRFLFDRAAVLCETGARIILAGPAGTGKTALVAELGRRMGLALHEHTGASLFARGWGRAEKNITAAVSVGRGCLTFFDEADSLMGSRFATGDNNSHLTLSATSAFLAALQDAHPRSPVIAATNRMDSLDPAIRRRFDVILTTKHLPEELEAVAWQKLLKLAPGPRWRPIGGTVPGDYVKAGRQMKLLGQVDHDAAAACIKRARDDRALEVIGGRKMQVGFF